MNFIKFYPVSSFILLVTVVTSFFQDYATTERFLFIPKRIAQKNEWYRFLTSALIHADFLHLLFNMMTFFFFGPVLEKQMGHLSFAGLYLFAQIVSHIPTYLQYKNKEYASLGASGAVSGVVFGVIMYYPWIKVYVFIFPMPAILYAVLFILFSHYASRNAQDHINHTAHLWGALAGFLFASITDPTAFLYFLHEIFIL
jgi:membrane associated rhomboid family serine protease